MAHTRAYCDGKLIKEGFPVADVSEFLAMPGAIVWVDYCKPTAADMEELQAELGFHELAVEDALSEHQRPKLDHYPNHLFLVVPCGRARRRNGSPRKRSRSTRSSTRDGS